MKVNLYQSKRLILRDYKHSDFSYIHQLLNDNEVNRYLFDKRFFSPSDTQQFIAQAFRNTKSVLGNKILLNKENNEFIGITGIQKCEDFLIDDYEFGFAIKKSSWGNGYAYEIGQFLIYFSFVHMGLKRIVATAHPQNAISIHLLQKLGMSKITEFEIKKRGIREIYEIYNK